MNLYFFNQNNLKTIFLSNRTDAHIELNQFRRKKNCALVVSGESLDVCLHYYQHEFMELATACPAVVCCRCNPTQKAQVVSLIQEHTGKRTCAIGDGGNDVSMIQQSDAGKNKEFVNISYFLTFFPFIENNSKFISIFTLKVLESKVVREGRLHWLVILA